MAGSGVWACPGRGGCAQESHISWEWVKVETGMRLMVAVECSSAVYAWQSFDDAEMDTCSYVFYLG